jgi:hypothetical protein
MNQFGLIIQETTAGSNQQFVSDHLDINSPEIKETITDERTLASQLANLSDVYSVQVTNNYKVYSLIVTNLTDFLGRSGYYAIRLYGPKGAKLSNFENILANIKNKFINYSKSNSLNNQNYDDILSSILTGESDKKGIVTVRNNFNCYYYFDEANSTLSTVFNTRGVHLVHKIYAFNKTKALNESIAISSGLKPFSQINAAHKEISIVNNYGVLNELKINDQLVDFNPNDSEFNLLCQNNDRIIYNTIDDKTYKPITSNFIIIEKKFIAPPKQQNTYSSSNNNKKKKNQNPYAMYFVIAFMVLIIGGGVYKILPPENDPTNKPHGPEVVNTDTIQETPSPPKEIKFVEQPYNTSDKEYITSYNVELSKFKFVFANNEWVYIAIKSPGGIMKFSKSILDKFTLTSEEKENFIKKLEKISGHKILDEITEQVKNTKVKNRKEENKKRKTEGKSGETDNNDFG